MTRRAPVALAGVVLAIAAYDSAAGAETRIDESEVCLVCHDGVSDELQATVSHPPARDGQCSSCHNPHTSRFDALLRERPASLCVSCHSEVGSELERKSVHSPVGDGRCVDCHEPHGGANAALLTRIGPDLCKTCHEDVALWQARPVQHVPFKRGQCGTCHEPHASDHPGLSREAGSGVCEQCHSVDAAFRSAHKGYPVERSDCQQCHDPHASEQAGLFRKFRHAPFAEGDCATCHALAASPDPFRTKVPMEQLCATCHESEVAESRDAPFPHVSAGGADCTTCHNPHTAEGPGLLDAKPVSLCLECHDPGGSASGEEGRYVTHGKDEPLDCTTCHTPHGGDRPLLLASDPVELCSMCHEHEHGVSHPMGEGSRDPRNGVPMTCLSCHGIHAAPYPRYLHRAGDKELCVSCHRNLVGGQ